MPLVSKTLPGLFNGVSQQPSAMRLENQSDLQENAVSDIVKGISKRPGTALIKTVSPAIKGLDVNSFTHVFEDENDKKYLVIATGDAQEPLKVVDMDGNEYTVEYTDEVKDREYLTCSNPKSDLRAINVDGDVVLLNRSLKTNVNETITAGVGEEKAALFNVKQSVPNCNYNIRLKDEAGNVIKDVSHTTGATPGGTTAIAQALYNQLLTLSTKTTYSVSTVEPPGYITASSPANTTSLGMSLEAASMTGSSTTNSYSTLSFWYKLKDSSTWTYGTTHTFRLSDGGSNSYPAYIAVASNLPQGEYQIKVVEEYTSPEAKPIMLTRIYWEAFSGNWAIYNKGSTIAVKLLSGEDFSIETSDGYADSALVGIKTTVSKFSDLPFYGIPGTVINVVGDKESELDDYYVRYRDIEDSSTGVWEETIKPGSYTHMLASTLPHKLIKKDSTTFTLQEISWSSREVGDDYSNPFPSFIGKPIKDIFFHRNRLGFISGGNVIFSRSGDFYNLFVSTATDILDNDPIDVSLLNNIGVSLQHACTFANGLVLFAKDRQFVPHSGQSLLTPKTIAIEPSTAFESNSNCKPVEAGPSIYFSTPKGAYSGIREYYTVPESSFNDAEDITQHVPYYIPKNVSYLLSVDSMDSLFVLTPDEPNAVYVYRYYWHGDERAQSSWSKWLFNDDVVSIFQSGSDLYVLTTGGSLLKVDESTETTTLFLDAKTTQYTASYDLIKDWTEIVVADYMCVDKDILQVINKDKEHLIPILQSSMIGKDLHFFLQGDYTSTNLLIGKSYTMRYRIPRFYVRDEKGIANVQGRLQIRNITPIFVDTGYFRLEKHYYRGKLVKTQTMATYNPIIVGVSKLGEHTFETGSKRFTILSNSENVDIDIINDSPLPCYIQTVAMEGMWSNRSRPIGGQ